MASVYDDWKKVLEDFQKSVTRELDEIRQHKEEVRQLKEEIFSAMNSGYFIRDDRRIVLSAPEIVIGNVDRDGVLMGEAGSRVILRAGTVNLEGVGGGGSVNTRAASIRNTAADPGTDGQEAVVGGVSEIVNQARQIVLDGRDATGVFSQVPRSAGEGSVSIHADGIVSVEASASTEARAQNIDTLVKQLEAQKKNLETEVSSGLKAFDSVAKSIKGIYDGNDDRTSDIMKLRTDMDDYEGISNQMKALAPALYEAFQSCSQSISRLAELNRQISCLKDEKSALPKADAFKKELTGAQVSIVGERIDLVSRDGDGNLRNNPDAGVGVLANDIRIEASDGTGVLQKEGSLLLHARNVEISTADAQNLKYNDKGELQSAEYPAVGDIKLLSKTLSVEAVDQELKDGELKEKALTKEGVLSVRIEKTDVSATDTEGKAAGSIALNAKDVAVRSMNVDKEKRTDDKLAEGSSMLLLSEKMYVGARKKDIKSKKLQLVTEEAGVFADKTLELQQGDAKAVLQLADGKAALSGSETQVYGKTTLNAKTEVKDEIKAPKATIDHVEAKSSFKSSNISDGIPVPPPPSTANLSAKLKAEDAPEKK